MYSKVDEVVIIFFFMHPIELTCESNPRVFLTNNFEKTSYGI